MVVFVVNDVDVDIIVAAHFELEYIIYSFYYLFFSSVRIFPINWIIWINMVTA